MRKLGCLLMVCSMTLFAACGDNTPGGSLVATGDEPAGANCANGGTKIDVGADDDGDGSLDASEVTNTTYVCNGGGTNSLVATNDEPPGENCPFGGTKIETGLDANHNNMLEASEIADVSFVCNVAPSGSISPSTGIVVAVKPGGVSTSTTGPITVRFTLKDDRGFPLDLEGAYSLNLAIQPRFSIGYFTKDATTNLVSPLTMYTLSTSAAAPNGQPTSYNPKASGPGAGTLTENGFGAGDYTYTFPTTSTMNGPQAVAYNPTKLNESHVVWIQASRQTDVVFQGNANTFFAANQSHYFIPSGTGTPMVREIASQAGCDGCHNKFKTEATASIAFHGGGRVAVGMCNTCHNPGRTTNPLADSASFIHRIHNGDQVATANLFHGIAATYPQDVRKCDTCHGGAAQGAQSLTNPSILACKGCHDYVNFAAPFATNGLQPCQILGNLVRGTDGKPLPCNHGGGEQADSSLCKTCHVTGAFATANYHKPVALPDPNNIWKPGGTNAYTNAAYVAAGGYAPANAARITYEISKVDTVTDATVTPSVQRPRISFKLKNNGTDVTFNTFSAGVTTELMQNFVGSPSVYFAFAVPQDGSTTAPSDFNVTASGYIKRIWDGSATGKDAGTISPTPDANGFYTIVLTGVQVPSTAKMLTGGVGYSYNLSSAPPLVQTNVPAYPWVPNTPADGKAQGGLIVPAPNVWKVAEGQTARRQIVDNAKCNKCHALLGVTPNFHVGQRNDGPTCSFCHTPNRSSAGWAASSKYFIHAIHAGRKRTKNYTWHAVAKGPGYDEIEFPGTLNTCTTCHVPNTYDFTNSANLTALASEQLTTSASGTLDPNPLTNSTYYTVSPYVVAGNYGGNFSYETRCVSTADCPGTTIEAGGTNRVITPLTAACVACHDSQIAIDHMQGNGGLFYAQRSIALNPATPKEQCMICHGPGRAAAIGVVHQR